MTTPAINRAIKRFDRAAQEYAFMGAAHPDDHEAIEYEYQYAELLLKNTIIRALNKAGKET